MRLSRVRVELAPVGRIVVAAPKRGESNKFDLLVDVESADGANQFMTDGIVRAVLQHIDAAVANRV